MSWFPDGAGAKAALMGVLGKMCHDDASIVWLAETTAALHGKWPGLGEVRAIYCSRFRPKDGIEIYSTVYPDGIPSQCERAQLPAGAHGALTPGGRTLQLEAPGHRLNSAERTELNDETINAVVAAQKPICPTLRERLEGEHFEALVYGDGPQIARLGRRLRGLDVRTPEEWRAIAEAEKQIADAKPTLSREEKERRLQELEAALGRNVAA